MKVIPIQSGGGRREEEGRRGKVGGGEGGEEDEPPKKKAKVMLLQVRKKGELSMLMQADCQQFFTTIYMNTCACVPSCVYILYIHMHPLPLTYVYSVSSLSIAHFGAVSEGKMAISGR